MISLGNSPSFRWNAEPCTQTRSSHSWVAAEGCARNGNLTSHTPPRLGVGIAYALTLLVPITKIRVRELHDCHAFGAVLSGFGKRKKISRRELQDEVLDLTDVISNVICAMGITHANSM